MSRVEVSMEYF